MKVGDKVEVFKYGKRYVAEPNRNYTKHKIIPQIFRIVRETKTMWIINDQVNERFSKKTLKFCGRQQLTPGNPSWTRMDMYSIRKAR